MRLGVWTPLPHTLALDPTMDKAIRETLVRGGGETPDRAYQYAVDVVRKAESYGFDITLVAERFLGPDLEAWILASALAAQTTRIQIMPAVHSGILTPQVAAKMGASLDRISGGRAAINLVNGWWEEEFDLYGNGAWVKAPEDRYTRMIEYITVMRGLWTEDPFNFEGKFYRVKNGSLPTKVKRLPAPPIFATSRADEGKDVIVQLCDVWFASPRGPHTEYESNFAGIKAEIADMKERAERIGRKISFGLAASILSASTDARAMEIADEMIAFGKTGRVPALTGSGLKTGLLGTPQTIAERMLRYAELGVDVFMLNFHPAVEALDMFAAEIMPRLKPASNVSSARAV